MAKFRVALLGDGSSIHVRTIAAELAQRGHTPLILTGSRHAPKAVPNGVELSVFDSDRFIIAKVAQVRRKLRRFQADIVHSHFVSHGGYLGMLTGFHPHVASAWGDDVWLEPHRGFLHRILVPAVLRSADAVLPVSRHLQEKVVQLSGRKEGVVLFNWGIDMDRFRFVEEERRSFRQRLGLAKGDLLVFSPRLLWPEYNHHVLLEAWRIIRANAPATKILLKKVRPQAEYLARLEQMIRDYGLAGDVIWIEELSEADLRAAYAASDIIVSLPGADGAPLTVQEAMGCQRVMLGGDTLGSRDWIVPGVTGEIVVIDPASVGEGLLRLLKLTPSQREEMGRVALGIISDRADRRKCFDILEKVYDQVAS